jgi:lipoic acid synthetase
VDVLTFGQYLRPTMHHLPVDRYVSPAEFDEIREEGMQLGFMEVVAGPLVRSSYKAEQIVMDKPGNLPQHLAHLNQDSELKLI